MPLLARVAASFFIQKKSLPIGRPPFSLLNEYHSVGADAFFAPRKP